MSTTRAQITIAVRDDLAESHAGHVVPMFIAKLAYMLKKEKRHVRWSNGGFAFCILQPDSFAHDILPKYYNHNIFASFVRQLNLYGFRKSAVLREPSLGKGSCEFYHDTFREGNDANFHKIVRVICASKNSASDPCSLARMAREVVDLKHCFEFLRQRCLELSAVNVNWYKSTNTDAAAAAVPSPTRLPPPPLLPPANPSDTGCAVGAIGAQAVLQALDIDESLESLAQVCQTRRHMRDTPLPVLACPQQGGRATSAGKRKNQPQSLLSQYAVAASEHQQKLAQSIDAAGKLLFRMCRETGYELDVSDAALLCSTTTLDGLGCPSIQAECHELDRSEAALLCSSTTLEGLQSEGHTRPKGPKGKRRKCLAVSTPRATATSAVASGESVGAEQLQACRSQSNTEAYPCPERDIYSPSPLVYRRHLNTPAVADSDVECEDPSVTPSPDNHAPSVMGCPASADCLSTPCTIRELPREARPLDFTAMPTYGTNISSRSLKAAFAAPSVLSPRLGISLDLSDQCFDLAATSCPVSWASTASCTPKSDCVGIYDSICRQASRHEI